MAAPGLVLSRAFRGEPPVRQPQLYLGLSDCCSCQGRPRGLWPVSSAHWRDTPLCLSHSLSLSHTHMHIFPSVFSPGGEIVTWSHYEIHTHSRRALQWTPVSKPPQVFSLWYVALTHTSGRSWHSLSPENISMQTVWESYAGRVCLHVLLCSSAVSLWHLPPEGTSNPITDLNKGNGSKASIPLILGSQGEQKGFLSTLRALQSVQRSQYLQKFLEFNMLKLRLTCE